MWKLSGRSQIIDNDEQLQVTRQPSSTDAGVVYVGGKAVKDSQQTSTYLCRCNIQALTGRDLLLLEEGDRYDDQLWLWTHNDAQAPQTGDLVDRLGGTYQVQSAEPWGNYTRCRLVRDDRLLAFDGA